jgi:hypothetical protein
MSALGSCAEEKNSHLNGLRASPLPLISAVLGKAILKSPSYVAAPPG